MLFGHKLRNVLDNQVHHAALLHDAPGPHPDDQACQAKAQGAPQIGFWALALPLALTFLKTMAMGMAMATLIGTLLQRKKIVPNLVLQDRLPVSENG